MRLPASASEDLDPPSHGARDPTQIGQLDRQGLKRRSEWHGVPVARRQQTEGRLGDFFFGVEISQHTDEAVVGEDTEGKGAPIGAVEQEVVRAVFVHVEVDADLDLTRRRHETVGRHAEDQGRLTIEDRGADSQKRGLQPIGCLGQIGSDVLQLEHGDQRSFVGGGSATGGHVQALEL